MFPSKCRRSDIPNVSRISVFDHDVSIYVEPDNASKLPNFDMHGTSKRTPWIGAKMKFKHSPKSVDDQAIGMSGSGPDLQHPDQQLQSERDYADCFHSVDDGEFVPSLKFENDRI